MMPVGLGFDFGLLTNSLVLSGFSGLLLGNKLLTSCCQWDAAGKRLHWRLVAHTYIPESEPATEIYSKIELGNLTGKK